MEQTTLGGSGLRVPRVGVGCSRFGRQTREPEAIELVNAAIELGVSLFDTADIYADGESERILGRAVAGKRDQCVVATKFRYTREAPGGSRRSVKLAVEASLRRLNTDYIDLYQMHGPDPSTPVEETIAALHDLVREGKILYFGFCNICAWEAVNVQRVAWSPHGSSVVSVQLPINAVDLSAYLEIKPVCTLFKLGLLASVPLARGMLAGNYTATNPPPIGHPLRSGKAVGYWTEKGLATSKRIREVAQRLECKPVHVALGVILSLPEVTSVLVGVNTTLQLLECSEAVSCRLDKSTTEYILTDQSRSVE